jgi:hypothetical protein
MPQVKTASRLEPLILSVNRCLGTSYYKEKQLQSWLENIENNAAPAVLSADILKTTADEQMLLTKAITWLGDQRKAQAQGNLLNKILPLLAAPLQLQLVKAWLKVENNNLPIKVLKAKVWPLISKPERLEVLEVWLTKKNNNLPFERLIEEALLIGIMPATTSLIQAWRGKDGNKDLPLSQLFKNTLSCVNEPGDKAIIIQIVLELEPDDHKRYALFTELVSNDGLGSKYNYMMIVKVYLGIALPIANIPKLCKDLYPSDQLSQAELFCEFLEDDPQVIEPLITDFVCDIADHDRVIKIIRHGLSVDILKDKAKLLEICKNRLSRHYKSLEVLLDISLNESLTAEGLKVIENNFGAITAAKIKLVDLFAYYDILDKLARLLKIIQPEILAKLKANFKPSGKVAYVVDAEYQKIKSILGIELPLMAVISEHLAKYVPPVEILKLSEITKYEIDFSNDNTRGSKAKSKLNKKFRRLLAADKPKAKDVASFFVELLGIEGEFGEPRQLVLLDLFKADRWEMACILSQPNGLNIFVACFSTLGDGCTANIRTQWRVALYSTLIKEPCSSVLYSMFARAAAKILNSGGDNLGLIAVNILANRRINDSAISPPGLFAELVSEFFADGKIERSAWQLIGAKLGEARQEALLGMLSDDMGALNEIAAKIAAYLVIENTVPELLASPYLVLDLKMLIPMVVSEFADVGCLNYKIFAQRVELGIKNEAVANTGLADYIRKQAEEVINLQPLSDCPSSVPTCQQEDGPKSKAVERGSEQHKLPGPMLATRVGPRMVTLLLILASTSCGLATVGTIGIGVLTGLSIKMTVNKALQNKLLANSNAAKPMLGV